MYMYLNECLLVQALYIIEKIIGLYQECTASAVIQVFEQSVYLEELLWNIFYTKETVLYTLYDGVVNDLQHG